jgi:ABC-type multidrug transport system fused ATPase/permease subunit
MLIIGLAKIEQGELTTGLLLGLFTILWQIYQPVLTIFSTIDTVQSGITAASRIEILKTAIRETQGKKIFRHFDNSIEYKNVTFSYDGSSTILNNFNLNIKKGEKIAIVGSTGAGKSTVIQLLLNLYEDYKGEILIDGTNLHHYTMDSIRERIVFITQDVHLFNDTIRNNIDIKNVLTDEEVIEIVTRVNLHELTGSLPKGINSKIGENGLNLSGGEKQRVSVARCFASNPQIVVLDEITASLDPENEDLLIKELENFLTDKTVISISHKLSTIKNFDRIIVLKSGKIIETGSFNELVECNGEFSSLFNINKNEPMPVSFIES